MRNCEDCGQPNRDRDLNTSGLCPYCCPDPCRDPNDPLYEDPDVSDCYYCIEPAVNTGARTPACAKHLDKVPK